MKHNNCAASDRAVGPMIRNNNEKILQLLGSQKSMLSSRHIISQEKTGSVERKLDTPPIKHNQSCALVVLFVSEYLDIPVKQLLWPTRSNAATAQARQIAIYIIHTMLSISYTDAARYFDRDRTTISHACHLIEDLRDDKIFDGKLERLEKLLAIAIKFSHTDNSENFCTNSRHNQIPTRYCS